MKLKHLTYFVLFVLLLNACKNDPKETEVVTQDTESKVTSSTSKTIKYTSEENIKLRLDLQVLNESNVVSKAVFSSRSGVVVLLASVKGKPQTTYTGEVMELKSGKVLELNSSNFKTWSSNGDKNANKIPSVITDDNGLATLNYSTMNWCLDCEDSNKNIKGKVLVLSEQIDNNSKIVAATIIK